MQYVVTGAAGSLGREVTRLLAEQGHEVTAIDIEYGRSGPDPKSHRFVIADLTDDKQVYRLLDGCDGVVHAGAIPHARFPLDGRAHRNNHLATYNVIEACAQLDIAHLVNVSSVQACGYFRESDRQCPTRLPFDESQDALPCNTYGLAKRFGEMTAQMVVNLARMKSVISIRFPIIVADWLVRRMRHRLENHPEHGLPDYWLYIMRQDAAETCARALQVDHVGHTIVYAHAGQPLSRRSWSELRAEFFADADWQCEHDDAPFVSLGRLQQLLGWLPGHTWQETLAEIEAR